ncbi:hypothetical protein [Bacillus sp. 1P02SD]|uniref:hypothetical protein n=1 Tax=Bacillus sp. 1P02SD TaxID=3132264 RepID=UPI0039A2742A
MKHFYNSKDIQQLLGLGSLRTAQLRIQSMNNELKAKGYWVEKGKVPIKFFYEKYPYLDGNDELETSS